MTVSADTVRSGLLSVLIVASVVAVTSLVGGVTPGATSAERGVAQSDGPTFVNQTVVEQRGDVARVSIQFGQSNRANFTIGSKAVNFEISTTVVDRNGDGEATVRINTAVAGLEGKSGITAVGEDEIADFEQTTGPIPGPLDAAVYDLRLANDSQLTDVGVLVLNERSTGEMTVWSAPDAARPNDSAALLDEIRRTDEISQGDWAVLAIDVSGVFGYVEDSANLTNPAYGLNFSVVEDPGQNQPERQVNVSEVSVLTDDTNDTLFVLLDTDNLTVDSEYTATFTIDDRSPYLESGENESANATFTVVQPTAADGEANETTAGENETRMTTVEETTTAGGTTEARDTEEVVRTTTVESSSVSTAGPPGWSFALVGLLVGATAVARRRG